MWLLTKFGVPTPGLGCRRGAGVSCKGSGRDEEPSHPWLALRVDRSDFTDINLLTGLCRRKVGLGEKT